MSLTVGAKGLVLPLSAMACYDLHSGRLLGKARVRLIEALPPGVGRHGAFEPQIQSRLELDWQAATGIGEDLAFALAGLMVDLNALPLDQGRVENLVSAQEADMGASIGLSSLVFLDCYAWEKPQSQLEDALRMQALHGKPIRNDLRRRYAAAFVA